MAGHTSPPRGPGAAADVPGSGHGLAARWVTAAAAGAAAHRLLHPGATKATPLGRATWPAWRSYWRRVHPRGLDLAAFSGFPEVTALFRAAQNGHLDVAEALIRAGAPLNVPDESWSPLHGAVLGSHRDLAALLLREGADADSRLSAHRMTPLGYANDGNMAALLIAAGADVNACPSGGFYPLHLATVHGRLEVLQELLSHPDIDVNKQDRTKCTPVHFAARWRYHECVAALLAAGADSCITDEDGRTPLTFCPEFRIISMLVAAGDRQWAHVPSPCPGLESALLSVWTVAPEELGELATRLEPEVKRRIQSALCTLHHASPRHLPDHIRMRLLDEAFTG